MQTKEMWKSTKWKVVAGAATLSALGIGGLAIADDSGERTQQAINLRDRASTTGVSVPVADVNVGPTDGLVSGNDSPFDDSDGSDSVTDGSAGSTTGDTPADLDTLTGDTPPGLDADSGGDSVGDDGVVAPVTNVPAPAAPAVAEADDTFDSPSGDSADSANGS
jgi:hypothetical protein